MSERLSPKVQVLLVLLTFSLLTCGCSTNPVTGKRQLLLIPQDQEIAMGTQAAPEFEKEFGGKVPDPQLQEYVQRVGKRVSSVSDRPMPYDFTLVSSDVPNAFALPGGKIFITAGLMSRMANERQLAAVLAHETVHVAARHNVMQMQQQMGTNVLIEIAGRVVGGDKGKVAQAATQVVTSMVGLKYSRDDEYEADQFGILYMVRAGYNPWGMTELLAVLYSLSKSEPGTLGEMLQTHPLTSKRIARSEQIIRSESKYRRYSPDDPDPQAGRFLKMRKRLLAATGKSE